MPRPDVIAHGRLYSGLDEQMLHVLDEFEDVAYERVTLASRPNRATRNWPLSIASARRTVRRCSSRTPHVPLRYAGPMPRSQRPEAGEDSTFWWIAGAIVLAAAAVRAWASGGELWIDEVWSVELARSVQKPLDVLLEIHQDNNHPLNTLLLAAIGKTDVWWAYRVPAVLAGMAALVGAMAIGLRRSRVEAALAGLLIGASALMIHYSSEARGYTLALAFVFACVWLLDPPAAKPRPVRALLFWICALLGACAHASFWLGYLPLATWWFAERLHDAASPREITLEGAAWHGVPLLILGLLWFFQLSRLQVLGGPEVSLANVLAATASLALGLPLVAPWRAAGAALAAGLLLIALVWRFRAGGRRWLLYLLGIVVLPLVALATTEASFAAPRYFLVGVALFLLLLAEAAAALFQHGRSGRLAACALCALFVAANAAQIAPLMSEGRGRYLEALRFMTEDESAHPVSIGSDGENRTASLIRFYAPYLETGTRPSPRFLRSAEWSEHGVDWYVLERTVEEKFAQPEQPVQELVGDARGNLYRLVRSYRSAPLSGADWHLYRNTGRTAR